MHPILSDSFDDSSLEELHAAVLHLHNWDWPNQRLADEHKPYQGIRIAHSRGTRDIYLTFFDTAEKEFAPLTGGFVVPSRCDEDRDVWPRMNRLIKTLKTANKRIAAGEPPPERYAPPEPQGWWVRCADGPAMGMRLTRQGIELGMAGELGYRLESDSPRTVFCLPWDSPYQDVLPLLVEFYLFIRDDNLKKYPHMDRGDVIAFG